MYSQTEATCESSQREREGKHLMCKFTHFAVHDSIHQPTPLQLGRKMNKPILLIVYVPSISLLYLWGQVGEEQFVNPTQAHS